MSTIARQVDEEREKTGFPAWKSRSRRLTRPDWKSCTGSATGGGHPKTGHGDENCIWRLVGVV